MKRGRKLLGLGACLCVLLLAACGEEEGANGNNVNQNDLGGGPCVETYAEPIVQIEAVSDAVTGDLIDVVFISNVERDGQEDRYFRQEETGITEEDDDESRLICTTPCGFGFIPGMWTFEVVAEGYQAENISVEADYEEFHGGCPSVSTGGTVITIELSPSS